MLNREIFVFFFSQVTGQKEFQILKGDNPCKVLKKYSKTLVSASNNQLDYPSVFNQLYDTISAQLIKVCFTASIPQGLAATFSTNEP